MDEFIAVNDSLESCEKNNNKNKTKTEISRLNLDYFQGRVWPDLWLGMSSLCGLFLCVILVLYILA